MAPLLSFQNLDNRLYLDGRFFGFGGGSGPSGLGFNYGYQFDGVDEYIDFGDINFNNGTQAISYSFWVKNTVSNKTIIKKRESTSLFESFAIATSSSHQLYFYIGTASGNRITCVSDFIINSSDKWYHCVVTYDGSKNASGVKFYVDGDLKPTIINTDNMTTNLTNSGGAFQVGKNWDGGTGYFNGRLDDIQYYNFVLNSTQVSDIYNSGYVKAPTSGPIHHWKLGEDDTFSTNWNVNDSIGSLNGTSVNMEQEDRKLGVAYSMAFDGVDEYVNFGNLNLFNQYNPFTISLWVKATSSRQGLISKTTSIYNGFVLLKNFNTIRFHFGTKEFEGIQVSSSWTITANEWTHIVATFDGTDANGVTLYKNTVSGQGINRNDSIGDVSNSDDLVFGSTDVLGSLNGNLMYVSIFDSELSASDVSNLHNNGVPVDPRDVGLSPSFFAPLGGENDSFSTNWTIVDEINGNNGTSVNMEESDKTSQTP